MSGDGKWEDAANEVTLNARETTLKLLNERAAGATICPSEVARSVAPGGTWREAMPAVHAAIDDLVSDGTIALSWKKQPLDKRNGPYRISLRSIGQ